MLRKFTPRTLAATRPLFTGAVLTLTLLAIALAIGINEGSAHEDAVQAQSGQRSGQGGQSDLATNDPTDPVLSVLERELTSRDGLPGGSGSSFARLFGDPTDVRLAFDSGGVK